VDSLMIKLPHFP